MRRWKVAICALGVITVAFIHERAAHAVFGPKTCANWDIAFHDPAPAPQAAWGLTMVLNGTPNVLSQFVYNGGEFCDATGACAAAPVFPTRNVGAAPGGNTEVDWRGLSAGIPTGMGDHVGVCYQGSFLGISQTYFTNSIGAVIAGSDAFNVQLAMDFQTTPPPPAAPMPPPTTVPSGGTATYTLPAAVSPGQIIIVRYQQQSGTGGANSVVLNSWTKSDPAPAGTASVNLVLRNDFATSGGQTPPPATLSHFSYAVHATDDVTLDKLNDNNPTLVSSMVSLPSGGGTPVPASPPWAVVGMAMALLGVAFYIVKRKAL